MSCWGDDWPWRIRTFGTISGVPASACTSFSSAVIPSSPKFHSPWIPLVAACRFVPLNVHAGSQFWHLTTRLWSPCWLLCLAPSVSTSFLLLGQIFHRNPHPSFAEILSPQSRLCTWVDSHFLLASICIPTCSRGPSFVLATRWTYVCGSHVGNPFHPS